MAAPSEVVDYCKTHSTIEAARHFAVSDSYIRRLKRQAKDDNPHIAGDDTEWPDPLTGELFPIVPGTSRSAWEQERNDLHERRAFMSRQAELEAELEEVPDDIIEGGTEAEQAEPELEIDNDIAVVSKDKDEPVSELPSIPNPVQRVVIVKRSTENWLLPYIAENFRFLLALVVAIIIIWSMSSAAHAAVLFR
jgi:hypothetical protein